MGPCSWSLVRRHTDGKVCALGCASNAGTMSLHSSIVGIGSMSSLDVSQQADPWARNAPKSVPNVKSCLSLKLLVCSVCQKLVCTNISQLKLISVTSPVKEKVDLTKFPLNLLRVTHPMMESSGPTRWNSVGTVRSW